MRQQEETQSRDSTVSEKPQFDSKNTFFCDVNFYFSE